MDTPFFFAKASRQNARNGVEHRADEVHGRLEAYPGALCRVGRGQRSIKVRVRRPCAEWQMYACFLIMDAIPQLAGHALCISLYRCVRRGEATSIVNTMLELEHLEVFRAGPSC